MKRLFVLGVALLVAAAALNLVPFGGTASAAPTTVSVNVGDLYFANPNPGSHTTTITAGDTVMWNWIGSALHSVTADDASFDAPAGSQQISGTFSHTFGTAGSFAYYCRVHGDTAGVGMSGTIVVQAAPAATDTPTAIATNTPAAGTATNTRTPTTTSGTATPVVSGTATPLASATVPAAEATQSSPPSSPPRAIGTSPASLFPPNTGTGDGGSGSTVPVSWLSAVIAMAGVAALAGAAAASRKRM